MKIGTTLKSLRENAHITQQELAKKCNLSASYLYDLESDNYNHPNVHVLKIIAKTLDVPVSIFFNNNPRILWERVKIGKTLKYLRKKACLTQTELANECDISKTYISGLENDLYNHPIIDVLKKISSTLDVPINIFFDNNYKFIKKQQVPERIEINIENLLNQTVNLLKNSEHTLIFDGDCLNNKSRELLATRLETSIKVSKRE